MNTLFKEYGQFILAIIGGGLGLILIAIFTYLIKHYGALFIWLITGGGAL